MVPVFARITSNVRAITRPSVSITHERGWGAGGAAPPVRRARHYCRLPYKHPARHGRTAPPDNLAKIPYAMEATPPPPATTPTAILSAKIVHVDAERRGSSVGAAAAPGGRHMFLWSRMSCPPPRSVLLTARRSAHARAAADPLRRYKQRSDNCQTVGTLPEPTTTTTRRCRASAEFHNNNTTLPELSRAVCWVRPIGANTLPFLGLKIQRRS